MELIKQSALFATLLHCVLAYSLPSSNLLRTAEPYDTKSKSFSNDIFEKPLHHKKPETETTDSLASPNDKFSYEMQAQPDFLADIVKNIKQFLQPEVPGGEPKEKKLKYPLRTPRVEIGVSGSNGILPVQIHSSHSVKPEPAKVLQSTSIDKSTKPMIDVLKDKDLPKQQPMFKPEYPKKEIMPLDYSRYRYEFPRNDFQTTPSDKPDLSEQLNPMNFQQIYPGVDIRKDQVGNPFQYTSPYSVPQEFLSLPYPTQPGVNANIQQIGNNMYTSTFKPDVATQSLKQEIFGNLPKIPDVYNKDVPANTDQYRQHEAGFNSNYYSSNNDGFTQYTPYKESPVKNIPMPTGYSPTKPIEEIALPPVPTSLSVLQRLQLVLLNTVAGLPGGVGARLEALAAQTL